MQLQTGKRTIVGMIEIRRYRLFPAAFDSSSLLLKLAEPGWDATSRANHETSRQALVEGLRHKHGDERIDQVVENLVDLGPDPWSMVGWHIGLWREIKHAFATCGYYSAATAAGALGERILNHLS